MRDGKDLEGSTASSALVDDRPSADSGSGLAKPSAVPAPSGTRSIAGGGGASALSDSRPSHRMVPEAEEAPELSWRSRADAAMARYAAGDDSAFPALYDSLSPHLYAFLFRRVHKEDKAKDLSQQTFMRMHEARGRYDADRSVVAWSFAIAHRFCIDAVRRMRPEVPGLEEEAGRVAQAWIEERDWDAVVDAKVALGHVEREVQRWPTEHRDLFSFAYIDGLSNSEIAAMLGTTENAVKQRLKRLREKLEETIRRAR